MTHSTHNGAPVFVLPEASYQSLQDLHSLMFLMASAVFAATREEEKIPMHIPRSVLAQCFQFFTAQLADGLDTAQRMVVMDHNVPRPH